ncbi:MAG: outer membrane beta-barrel protein [Chryseolinea sp.]
MKNIVKILFASFCVTSATSYAQSNVEVGIRFMPQVVALRYDYGVGSSYDFLKTALPGNFAPHYSRVRTSQGIGIVYNPVQKIRLAADLLYSLQGGGYEERKTNLNYIKVPLLVGYNASPNRKLIFIVQTGIELSYLTSATIKREDGEVTNIRNYLNKTTWGVPFAIGFKFRVLDAYFITAQLYLYSDFHTLSKTNKALGVYNYVYPGLRISLDRNLFNLKIK